MASLKAIQPRTVLHQDVDQPSQQRRLLTAREACVFLGLGSLGALYHHIRENRLPTRRVGGRYRFEERELDAWTQARQVERPFQVVGSR